MFIFAPNKRSKFEICNSFLKIPEDEVMCLNSNILHVFLHYTLNSNILKQRINFSTDGFCCFCFWSHYWFCVNSRRSVEEFRNWIQTYVDNLMHKLLMIIIHDLQTILNCLIFEQSKKEKNIKQLSLHVLSCSPSCSPLYE